MLTTPALTSPRGLKTLVENRTVYALNNCELNLFETYQESVAVPLKFNDLVVTSMLRGKKVMRLFDDPEFDYLPGETVIVPSNVEMKIDFPEATFENPTQCLALAIDHGKICETLAYLNERYPKSHGETWELSASNYFFYNNSELAATLNKLIVECMSTSIGKDALVDLALQELLVRLIQNQSAHALSEAQTTPNSPVGHVAAYIRQNIHRALTLKELSDLSCMSTSTFYRMFKRDTGLSPIEFILNEKIKHAKKLLRTPGIQINEVSFQAGFEDCNYFIRLFKKYEGITPKQYQMINAG